MAEGDNDLRSTHVLTARAFTPLELEALSKAKDIFLRVAEAIIEPLETNNLGRMKSHIF